MPLQCDKLCQQWRSGARLGKRRGLLGEVPEDAPIAFGHLRADELFDVELANARAIARVPDQVRQLLDEGGKLILPKDRTLHPHPHYLTFHRHKVFKA